MNTTGRESKEVMGSNVKYYCKKRTVRVYTKQRYI